MRTPNDKAMKIALHCNKNYHKENNLNTGINAT
jgi:hypothetical protein